MADSRAAPSVRCLDCVIVVDSAVHWTRYGAGGRPPSLPLAALLAALAADVMRPSATAAGFFFTGYAPFAAAAATI